MLTILIENNYDMIKINKNECIRVIKYKQCIIYIFLNTGMV